MSYETRYAARKRREEQDRDASAQALADRIRYQEILARVIKEREALYPSVTAENAAEVFAWQDARIRELRGT